MSFSVKIAQAGKKPELLLFYLSQAATKTTRLLLLYLQQMALLWLIPTTLSRGVGNDVSWFEPTSAELHQTGTFEGRTNDWAIAPLWRVAFLGNWLQFKVDDGSDQV